MILKAFENGADGVMVVGCLEGDCHYISGNLRARSRVERVASILDHIGLGGGRVAMYNLSAGEGVKFARFVTEMVDRIRELGPNPVNIARKEMERSTIENKPKENLP